MQEKVCEVYTHSYEADIGRLMTRRLQKRGEALRLAQAQSAGMCISSQKQMETWIAAVSELLLWDLAHLELAARVEALPITLREKQQILPEALRLSKAVEGEETRCLLRAYFQAQDRLNLEGFLHFRLRHVEAAWDGCVARAAEEVLLEAEYRALIGVLSAFVQMQPPRIKNVYIILNPDGSCTLRDDMESRIDYERCTGDGVVSVLIGLAPERITVYDFSGGRSAMLADVLIRVFEDRVRYFK